MRSKADETFVIVETLTCPLQISHPTQNKSSLYINLVSLQSNEESRAVIDQFMMNNNVSVSFFQIRWFTKRWNRLFVTLGKFCNLTVWFNAGNNGIVV